MEPNVRGSPLPVRVLVQQPLAARGFPPHWIPEHVSATRGVTQGEEEDSQPGPPWARRPPRIGATSWRRRLQCLRHQP